MSAERLDHIIAGALYDFMGWLTTRPERLVLSSADDAVPAVDALTEFLTMRGVDQKGEPMIEQWHAGCGTVRADISIEDRHLRLKEVLAIFPISRSAWWAGVKDGRYPKPVKLGGATLWRVRDIKALIDYISEEQPYNPCKALGDES